jgi:type II secretory pathway pseudopilin PulG
MKPACRTERRRRGLTLIETLIGTAILVLLASLFFTVYRTTSSVLERQGYYQSAWRAAIDALDAVSRDVACAIPGSLAGKTSFVLDRERDGNGSGPSTLLCCTALPTARGRDATGIGMQRIRYAAVETAGNAGRGVRSLVRETVAGSGDRPSATEELLGNVVEFGVTVLGPDGWVEAWPPLDSAALPAAARIRLVFKEGSLTKTLETEVLIGAGANTGKAARGLAVNR